MEKEEFINKYLSVLPECTIIKELPKRFFHKEYVTFTCKVHGDYSKRADTMKDYGCKGCNRDKAKAEYDNKWKVDCSLIHNDKFDYSNTIIGDVLTCSEIRCRICDLVFKQTPASHKWGRGCPNCKRVKIGLSNRNNIDFVISKAKNLGFDYDFSKSVYNTCKDDIEITCDKGHIFFQSPDELLNAKHGCQKCSSGKSSSKAEKEILDFVRTHIYCEENNRTVLDGLELDIYIPSIKVGIEFNGLYWHRDGNNKVTHFDKRNMCAKRGVHLIHIYEDDWRDREEVVKTKLVDSLQFKSHFYEYFDFTACVIKEEKELDLENILKNHSLNTSLNFDGAYSMYFAGELMGLAYYIERKGYRIIVDVFRLTTTKPNRYYFEFVKYFTEHEAYFEIACSLDWLDELFLKYNKNEVKGLVKPRKKYIVSNKLVNETKKENVNTITKAGHVIYKM